MVPEDYLPRPQCVALHRYPDGTVGAIIIQPLRGRFVAAVTLNSFQGLCQALAQIPKQVRNDGPLRKFSKSQLVTCN